MVVFDASVLIDLFNPALQGERRERLDLLVKTLSEQGEIVMIPTPAYAEFLVKADRAKTEYHSKISSSRFFNVEPFSVRAAIDCAELLEKAFSLKERRGITRTKFKFDWMIVAAAKAHSAICIYHIDDDITRCAQRAGIPEVHVDTLPLPKGNLPLFPSPLPVPTPNPAAPPPA